METPVLQSNLVFEQLLTLRTVLYHLSVLI
jgi:hypothetical protein